MKIILINGLKGSGKDTLADLLCSHLAKKGFRVHKIPNAEHVKKIASTMYNWNGLKDAKGRQLLIDITNTGYKYCPTLFEDITYEKAKTEDLDILVVPDWRYLATYTYFCEHEGTDNVSTIRVIRSMTTKDNATLDNDPSEINLNLFPFHQIIYNEGTLSELDLMAQLLYHKLNI